MIVASTDTKVVNRDEATHIVASARDEGNSVVLTNGVFDLLHLGHVRYLQEARALGDILVVGLNDDESVRQLKGPARPLVPVEERAIVLSALECVDLVVPFCERTAEALVAALQPHIYVKGGDYNPAAPKGQKGYLPEARTVAGYGGRVTVLSFLPGHSTSEMIRRIVSRFA